MRVVLDTNILVSSLIVPRGVMKYVCDAWQADRYTLISSFEQLDEFRRVTRYERIQKYLRPATAGTMLNRIRALAELVSPLPLTDICADPADNYLLAMAAHGRPIIWQPEMGAICFVCERTGTRELLPDESLQLSLVSGH